MTSQCLADDKMFILLHDRDCPRIRLTMREQNGVFVPFGDLVFRYWTWREPTVEVSFHFAVVQRGH